METPDSSAAPGPAGTPPANPPTSRLRAFARTGLGGGLAVLALLSVFAGKLLLPSHRAVALPLVGWALLYGIYFLWARGAKVKTRVLTGMDAVRDEQRRHRYSD